MTIYDARFIPGTLGAYALSNTGTLSKFHMTPNPFEAPVAWNDTDLDNAFTRIVPELNGLNVYIQGVSDQTPAGCADDWEIGTGTETSRTSSSITADSALLGSHRIVINVIGTRNGPAPADGFCRNITTTFTSTPVAVTAGWFLPGASYPGDEQIGLFSPTYCVWWLDVSSSVPFSMQFDLDSSDTCGDCGSNGGDVITAYSTDSGANFDPIKIVGVLPSLGYTGMDTIKIGTTAILGAGSQVFRANSGGDWELYSGTLPSGSQPNALYIPRWQFGGTVTPNINTSSPQYLMGSGTISAAGETLWKVTTAGSLFTPISPKIGTLAGEIVSPDALAMNWNSGKDILAIARFGSDFKLCVSNNTGSTWKFTGLDDGAREVVSRRSDIQIKQAILSNSEAGGLINNYRAGTVIDYDRFFPGSTMYSIDVYG